MEAPTAEDRVLSARAAQAYYDRFGKKQDSQGFYEDRALDDLIANADLPNCQQAFEFGCGTGPALVGGCRPIQVDAFVNPQDWKALHRSVVTPFGVPSEVLILETTRGLIQ